MNHFKSKGSGGPWPGDADAGDGQGSSNESRVRQAEALSAWVDSITDAGDAVALIGDFNAYTRWRTRSQVLYDDGYADATVELAPGEYSYSFGGQSGSLDHVLLNEAGARPGDRSGHLGDQRRRVDRPRVQPVQLPRHAVLRR